MVEFTNDLVINVDGTIYKCPAFVGREGFTVGDLRNGVVDNVDAYNTAVWKKQECLDCAYLPQCFGGVGIDKGSVQLAPAGKRAAEGDMEEERILKALQSDGGAYARYKDTAAVAEFRKRGLLESRSRGEHKRGADNRKGRARGRRGARGAGPHRGRGQERHKGKAVDRQEVQAL